MLYLNNTKTLDDAQNIYLNGKEVMGIYVGVPNKNLLRSDYEILTGTLNTYNQFGTSGFHVFIPIHQDGVYYYTLSQASGSNGVQIALANENKYIISGTRNSNTSSTVKTKQLSIDTSSYPTAKYVVVCWYYDTYDYHMVYFNDSSTEYIPYEWSRQKIYSGGDYIELDYVETSTTTGGYQIDYVPTVKTGIELSFANCSVESKTTGSGGTYMFCDGGWGYRFGYSTRYIQGSFSSYLESSVGTSSLTPFSMDGNHILPYQTKVTMTVQNQKVSVSTTSTTYTHTGTYAPKEKLQLGGTYITNSSFPSMATRIYECKVFDPDGNLLYHLIPVLKKTDNKPYLYDKVNDIYYTTLKNVYPTNYAIKQ